MAWVGERGTGGGEGRCERQAMFCFPVDPTSEPLKITLLNGKLHSTVAPTNLPLAFIPGPVLISFKHVAMTVSDNQTASTYESMFFLRSYLCFSSKRPHVPTAACSIRVQGLPVFCRALSLTPRMLRDTNVI